MGMLSLCEFWYKMGDFSTNNMIGSNISNVPDEPKRTHNTMSFVVVVAVG